MPAIDENAAVIHGEDSMQALCLALRYAHSMLQIVIQRGGRLVYSRDQVDIPLQAYFGSDSSLPAAMSCLNDPFADGEAPEVPQLSADSIAHEDSECPKLLTVEDVFEIAGEVIVVPGPRVGAVQPRSKIAVLLRRPDGRVIEATASLRLQFQSPPPDEHRIAVILNGVGKSDVPIGTEIWLTGGRKDER